MPDNPLLPSDLPGRSEDAQQQRIQADRLRAEAAALEAELGDLHRLIEQRRIGIHAARATLSRLDAYGAAPDSPSESTTGDHSTEILESISDAFYALDINFNFVFVNSKALEIWGRPRATIIGRNFWDEFPRARNTETGNMHLQAMSEGRALRYETFSPIIHTWIDVSIYPDRNGGLCVYFRDITDRKKTEAALRDSESRLRIITDLVPDLIWCCGPSGHADWYNKRWLEYTGLDRKDALGEGWIEVMHPEDREAWRFAYQEATLHSTYLQQVLRIRRHDRVYRWFLMQVEIQKSESGAIVRTYGTATDIHEQRTVLDALRESEAQLRVTLESATDYAIVSTDTAGIIDGWSAGAELIFGYAAAEAIGLPADILFTPEDVAAGVPDEEMGTARTRGWAADERWHMRRDGTRFYMSGVMRPIFNPDLRGYVKVARDMTEQQEAADRLRVSEERLRIALKSAGLGAWDWDIRNNQSIWNEQHYLMLGLKPREESVRIKVLLDHIHPEDLPAVRAAMDEAVLESGIFKSRFRILRADTGAERWMQGYGRVIDTAGSPASRMVGVMYDITESRSLEQQKDQFIAVASHELRTPVTAMKSYAEVLREILAESGQEQSFKLIQKLNAQIDRLADLVRDLLDVTRIREGRLGLRTEPFELESLLLETIEEMSYDSRARIELHGHGPAPVVADRERIRQVLNNLLSNAIRYSPKDAAVILSFNRTGESIEVTIRDYGPGVAPELTTQLFERYFRGGTGQDSTFPGMGLGLYIAAEIIHRHGGSIWAENATPQGACFHFTIPAHQQ